MKKTIDTEKTLSQLNIFAEANGLPPNNFQRVWVDDNKLMVEHTPPKRLFAWPWSKPKPPTSQVWVKLNDAGEPVQSPLGEHTVVVFETPLRQAGFKL